MVVITEGTRGEQRPEIHDDVAAAIAAERDPQNSVTVSVTVTRWHPVIVAWDEEDRRQAQQWPGSDAQTRPNPLERRRRRLLNAFFRALERRGWSVATRERGGFTVTLLSATVDLTCMNGFNNTEPL